MKLMISSVVAMVAAVMSVEVAAQPRGEMGHRGGWMDGGAGGGDVIWIVIGVLVVVLLVVVITKIVNTKT